jgi:hypothetical protein
MARSLGAHLEAPGTQAMYGIIHGGTDAELRASSAAYLCSLPFGASLADALMRGCTHNHRLTRARCLACDAMIDGFAIGGALGRDRAEMMSMLAKLVPQLRLGAPLHLLGIGDEASIRSCVPLGLDTFDSAFPTRLGRHGTLLTSEGRLTLRKAEHARALRPPDPACDCHVCKTYSLVRMRTPCVAPALRRSGLQVCFRARRRICTTCGARESPCWLRWRRCTTRHTRCVSWHRCGRTSWPTACELMSANGGKQCSVSYSERAEQTPNQKDTAVVPLHKLCTRDVY